MVRTSHDVTFDRPTEPIRVVYCIVAKISAQPKLTVSIGKGAFLWSGGVATGLLPSGTPSGYLRAITMALALALALTLPFRCSWRPKSPCRQPDGDVGDEAAAARCPKNGGESSSSESAVTLPCSSPPLASCSGRAALRLLLSRGCGCGCGCGCREGFWKLSVDTAAAAGRVFFRPARCKPPGEVVSARGEGEGGRRFDAAEHPSTLTGRSTAVLERPFDSKELSCIVSYHTIRRREQRVVWSRHGRREGRAALFSRTWL